MTIYGDHYAKIDWFVAFDGDSSELSMMSRSDANIDIYTQNSQRGSL